MKRTIIALLCIALIAGGILLMLPTIQGRKFKNDTLIRVSVSTGGGMLGGHRSATLRTAKDGSVTLSICTRETHANREITTTYPIDPNELNVISNMANEYNLYGASKRPMSKFEILDGDTTRLSFDYAKGDFDISSEQVLSQKMSEGFWKVNDYLYSLANDKGITTIEPQTATLYLRSGYTEQFIVEDAFDNKLDILNEEHPVEDYQGIGILLVSSNLDTSSAESISSGKAGTIAYAPSTGNIIILYADYDFGEPIYQLAHLEDFEVPYACPLIKDMEGNYRLYLN